MPYIQHNRKVELDKNQLDVQNVGELNYVFTKFFIDLWNSYPKYVTIHKICLLSRHPEFDPDLGLLCRRLVLDTRPPITRQDVAIALELAFHEFYRRVGASYESRKANENGDVYRDIKDTPVYASKSFVEEGDR